ncbi:MAG: PfkB family carbohydrate kinase, partial [Microbacterium sp.]
MTDRRVVVCGSLNADTTFRVGRIPIVGETVVADATASSSGGKGANQAYAAARTSAGHPVLMIGAVGDDGAGSVLCDELAAAGVDVTGVRRSTQPTGQALIAVDRDGGNIIIVAPGANHDWPADAPLAIRADDVVVLQLEIPLAVATRIAQHGHEVGATVVLNAAPAVDGAIGLLPFVDVLVVNEFEASQLLAVDAEDRAAVEAAAARHGTDVVVTRGEAST